MASWKNCTDRRAWSLLLTQSPEAVQMQHRETERRQLEETESKIFRTGFDHLRKDWPKESGSSGRAGDTIPETPLPRRKLLRNHKLSIHFPKDPNCGYMQTHKNHETSMQKES